MEADLQGERAVYSLKSSRLISLWFTGASAARVSREAWQ